MFKVKPSKPRFAESSIVKPRMLKGESDLEKAFPPEKHEGMSEDKGPEPKEFEKSHFAEGGEVNKPDYVKKEDKGYGSIIMPSGPEDTPEEDHHASIAAAIMARKGLKKLAEGGMMDDSDDAMQDTSDDSDSDSMDMGPSSTLVRGIMSKHKAETEKFAEGGMAGMDDNEESADDEGYDHADDAALKENYDEDFSHLDDDSDDEIGDPAEKPKMSITEGIRRKMKK